MQDSGESEDSEIEPDSPRREKQFTARDRPGNQFKPKVAEVEGYQGNRERSHNTPRDSIKTKGCNPSLYSLLREEREAELDSDLLIESASEESPKREQVVKCTLKPHSPPSSPPPVSSAVVPPLKENKQEVKEEKKEKPSTVERDESNPRPLQQEGKMFIEAKPKAAQLFEQRPLEDRGNKTTGVITEEKRDAKEAELLLFLHTFNKQKGMERQETCS